MSFFDTYVSNTLAGSAPQTCFRGDGIVRRARVYYRLFCGGNAEHALLFSNTTDSTFADGSRSVCDTPCGEWKIFEMRAGLCSSCGMDDAAEPSHFEYLSFGGTRQKTVARGERFVSDPFMLDAREGEFLCLEITFGGYETIPCHDELWVASFVEENGQWVSSTALPVPSMIGVRRDVKSRIAFFGDSITQGIGSTKNSYLHWNARLAENIGRDYAFWNLGIGYARSGDAAKDGVWLQKAKQNDVVVLCLGVNDILQGVAPDEIIENLKTVTALLQNEGIRVLLQSVPPFEFSADGAAKRRYINEHLDGVADGFFDTAAFLTDGDTPIYGGHPNDDGCALWAKHLWVYMKDFLGI